jgi:type I restriction enzyme R subunit
VASTGLEADQVDSGTANKLLEATEELVAIIQQEIAIPNFWKPSHIPDQEVLKQQLFTVLMMGDLVPSGEAEAVAERLFDLARSNHGRLVSA